MEFRLPEKINEYSKRKTDGEKVESYGTRRQSELEECAGGL